MTPLGCFGPAVTDDNPIIFAEHALLYGTKGEVPDDWYDVPIGSAVVRRGGDDVTIVAYSRMAHSAEEAAEELRDKTGREAEVIDLRTLRPLDMDTVLESVKKTSRVVVVEEAWRTGGFAGEIASSIQEEAFDHLDGPVIRVAGADVPAPYARGSGVGRVSESGKYSRSDRTELRVLRGVRSEY